MNKIFENYFKQNLKEELEDDRSLGRMTFDEPTQDEFANHPLAGYIMQRLTPFLQEMLDDIEELSGRLKNVETGNTQVASLEENLVKEQVPADQLTQVLDVEGLPDEKRRRVYSILAKSNQEFTDVEMRDYLQMLDNEAGDLEEFETNFILRNTDASDLEGDDETSMEDPEDV